MATLPNHGTMRRYKAGCRCDPCTVKNTETKQRERDRKRERDGLEPSTRKPVPTTPKTNPPDPEHGPIETAARAALAEFEDDKVAALRCQVIYAAARIMDDKSKAYLFATQFNVLRETVKDILTAKPEKDGEGDELRNFMASLGSARGNRSAAPVDNTA